MNQLCNCGKISCRYCFDGSSFGLRQLFAVADKETIVLCLKFCFRKQGWSKNRRTWWHDKSLSSKYNIYTYIHLCIKYARTHTYVNICTTRILFARANIIWSYEYTHEYIDTYIFVFTFCLRILRPYLYESRLMLSRTNVWWCQDT